MSHLYGLDRHCYHPAVTSAYLAANWGGQDEAVRDMNDLKPNVLWEQMLFASAAVRTASFREVELPGYDVLQFAELPKFRAVDALRGFDKVLESQDVKKRDDTVSELNSVHNCKQPTDMLTDVYMASNRSRSAF